MTKIQETSAALEAAKARATNAEAALAKIKHDLEHGDRATIAGARAKEDDARGEFNEATLELEQAERAHAAAVTDDKRTKLKIAIDAHNETSRILAKDYGNKAAAEERLNEIEARERLTLQADAMQCETIRQLSAELGEPMTPMPITVGVARALEIEARKIPADPEVRAKLILRHLGHMTALPPLGMTVIEAAALCLAERDPGAADREQGRRNEERDAPLRQLRQMIADARATLREREDFQVFDACDDLEAPASRMEKVRAARKTRELIRQAQQRAWEAGLSTTTGAGGVGPWGGA